MSKKKEKKEKHHKGKKQEKKKDRSKAWWYSPKWIRWGIVFILSVVLVFLSLFWLPAELHYEITETYTFSAEEMAPLYLTVLLPTSGPYQDVLEPEITWPGSWDIHSDGRLNVLRMESDIQAGETVEAVITFRVDLFQGSARWFGEPVRSDDLAPSEDIQSASPEIIARANELTVSGNDRQTARQIFDFTIRHLDWPKESRVNANLSALNAYETGVGGCAEHANLVAALCRAAGIPTKTISGLAMPETVPFIPVSATWGHPAGAHAWNEIFIDDAWSLADPSWSGQFYKRDLFGWADGKHLAYDEIAHEAQVYTPLLAEAEDQGTWIAAMSAPLKFVAWSEMDIENMQFSPAVTLRKTWDGRFMMMVSVILILVMLNWLIDGDNRRLRENWERN